MPEVIVFVLNGWDEAHLAVQAWVVEPVDVLGDNDLAVGDISPRPFHADEFGPQLRDESSGESGVSSESPVESREAVAPASASRSP